MVSCTDGDIVFVVQDGSHFNGLETSDAKGYHTGLVLKSAGSTIKFYTVDLSRLFDEVGGHGTLMLQWLDGGQPLQCRFQTSDGNGILAAGLHTARQGCGHRKVLGLGSCATSQRHL